MAESLGNRAPGGAELNLTDNPNAWANLYDNGGADERQDEGEAGAQSELEQLFSDEGDVEAAGSEQVNVENGAEQNGAGEVEQASVNGEDAGEVEQAPVNGEDVGENLEAERSASEADLTDAAVKATNLMNELGLGGLTIGSVRVNKADAENLARIKSVRGETGEGTKAQGVKTAIVNVMMKLPVIGTFVKAGVQGGNYRRELRKLRMEGLDEQMEDAIVRRFAGGERNLRDGESMNEGKSESAKAVESAFKNWAKLYAAKGGNVETVAEGEEANQINTDVLDARSKLDEMIAQYRKERKTGSKDVVADNFDQIVERYTELLDKNRDAIKAMEGGFDAKIDAMNLRFVEGDNAQLAMQQRQKLNSKAAIVGKFGILGIAGVGVVTQVQKGLGGLAALTGIGGMSGAAIGAINAFDNARMDSSASDISILLGGGAKNGFGEGLKKYARSAESLTKGISDVLNKEGGYEKADLMRALAEAEVRLKGGDGIDPNKTQMVIYEGGLEASEEAYNQLQEMINKAKDALYDGKDGLNLDEQKEMDSAVMDEIRNAISEAKNERAKETAKKVAKGAAIGAVMGATLGMGMQFVGEHFGIIGGGDGGAEDLDAHAGGKNMEMPNSDANSEMQAESMGSTVEVAQEDLAEAGTGDGAEDVPRSEFAREGFRYSDGYELTNDPHYDADGNPIGNSFTASLYDGEWSGDYAHNFEAINNLVNDMANNPEQAVYGAFFTGMDHLDTPDGTFVFDGKNTDQLNALAGLMKTWSKEDYNEVMKQILEHMNEQVGDATALESFDFSGQNYASLYYTDGGNGPVKIDDFVNGSNRTSHMLTGSLVNMDRVHSLFGNNIAAAGWRGECGQFTAISNTPSIETPPIESSDVVSEGTGDSDAMSENTGSDEMNENTESDQTTENPESDQTNENTESDEASENPGKGDSDTATETPERVEQPIYISNTFHYEGDHDNVIGSYNTTNYFDSHDKYIDSHDKYEYNFTNNEGDKISIDARQFTTNIDARTVENILYQTINQIDASQTNYIDQSQITQIVQNILNETNINNTTNITENDIQNIVNQITTNINNETNIDVDVDASTTNNETNITNNNTTNNNTTNNTTNNNTSNTTNNYPTQPQSDPSAENPGQPESDPSAENPQSDPSSEQPESDTTSENPAPSSDESEENPTPSSDANEENPTPSSDENEENPTPSSDANEENPTPSSDESEENPVPSSDEDEENPTNGKGPDAHAGENVDQRDVTPPREEGTTYVEATPENHVNPEVHPGDEVQDADASVYDRVTVPATDANGEPTGEPLMRDPETGQPVQPGEEMPENAQTYITNPDGSETEEEVRQNIADDTQTTYGEENPRYNTTDAGEAPARPTETPSETGRGGAEGGSTEVAPEEPEESAQEQEPEPEQPQENPLSAGEDVPEMTADEIDSLFL